MPLLFLALDNTVLDRTAAFHAWGRQFLAEIGAPSDDLRWLVNVDADGLTSRWDVADAIIDRYRPRLSTYTVAEELHEGVLRHLRLEPVVALALRIARDAGCAPVVVTNSTAREAEDRIRHTGLGALLADCVVAEEVGVSKPNPRIFAIAARRLNMYLDDAWVVGDSPELDIGAAAALGVRSVWVSRGRGWTESRYRPTCVADGMVAAVATVLGAGAPVARGGPPPMAYGWR